MGFRAIIILVIGLQGCISTKKLKKHLTAHARSLSYIQDTDRIPESQKTSQRLIVEVVDSGLQLSPVGNVTVTKSSVLPLVIFNQWNKHFNYQVGDREIADDLPAFVRKATIREINRSTPFVADSVASNGDQLKLSIKIERCDAAGPYKVEGFFLYLFLIYLFYEEENAGPGTASSKFSCTLSQGEKKLFTKTFESRKSFDGVVSEGSTPREFRSAVSFSLTELLSSTLKENVEAAVRETEYYLKNE